MGSKINLLLFLTIAFLASCFAPQKAVSTLESTNYEEAKDQTTFNKFPFGSLSMPGKWKKVSYNPTSHQHNFRNIDSIFVAVAINQASSYPFYKYQMSSNKTVKEMYDWDSKYLTEQVHGIRTVLKQDTTNHFILWQLTCDTLNRHVDTYYLFGCENKLIFSVMLHTKKWNENQKINFLQTVYKNKIVGTCCN